MGAAAAALGCMVNAVPSRPGAEAGAPAALMGQALSALQAALESAPRLSQSTSARRGVAQGLAALLGAPHMLPDAAGADTWLLTQADCAGHAKQALEVRTCWSPPGTHDLALSGVQRSHDTSCSSEGIIKAEGYHSDQWQRSSWQGKGGRESLGAMGERPAW